MLKIKNISKINFLLNSLKRAFIANKNSFSLKKENSYILILDLFSKLGFIKSFEKYNNILIIRPKSFFNLNKKIPSISLIKYNIRLTRKPTISVSELISLQRREGGTSLFILNTDKGLLTSYEAIQKNVGGSILFKIN